MLVRRDTAAQHLARVVRILVGVAALFVVCGLPMAAKYPEAFTGDWAWAKYIGLGAAFVAVDLVVEGIAELVRRQKRRPDA